MLAEVSSDVSLHKKGGLRSNERSFEFGNQPSVEQFLDAGVPRIDTYENTRSIDGDHMIDDVRQTSDRGVPRNDLPIKID